MHETVPGGFALSENRHMHGKSHKREGSMAVLSHPPWGSLREQDEHGATLGLLLGAHGGNVT